VFVVMIVAVVVTVAAVVVGVVCAHSGDATPGHL